MWVIFCFCYCFSEFVGGLAIRKIDTRSCLCVFAPAWTLLLSSLQPPHSDSPGAWQPPTLSSYQSPCSPGLTLPLISPPPLTFVLHFGSHQLFLSPENTSISSLSFPHPFLLCLSSISSPLTCCVGLLCLSLCSLHPLCTVSVSMVTPRGQEWLRGLRDTDTDGNGSHTYFVSTRVTCLQACVHIRDAIPCDGATTNYHRITGLSAAWNGGRAAALLFSLRCCSFQYPDEEGDHLMMLQGKLCIPFWMRPFACLSHFSHILHKSHSHISTLMSLLGCVTCASFRSKRI